MANYCAMCGKPVGQGMRFCPSCASPVNQEYKECLQNQNDVREQTIQQVSQMISYFGVVSEKYVEYDEVLQKIDNGNRASKGLLRWGISLSIIFVLFLCISICSGDTGGTIAMLGVYMFLPGSGLLTAHFIKESKRKKCLVNWVTRSQTLYRELSYHYMEYGPCQVQIQYTHPSVFQHIYAIILNKKADTVETAMNYFLAEANHGYISLPYSCGEKFFYGKL